MRVTSWISIKGLRMSLVAGAAVLLVLLVGFLGVAHFRAHRLLGDLPRRLGADIEKETNGFTYSQAVEGRTVFTLHAATATEHRDGKVMLHDVGIVLYGREQTRADRIYGKEFEYDQKNGVVRATGEVHLDLGAPAPADTADRVAYAAGREPGARQETSRSPELVHVKTSGLVYVQSLGVASTAEQVEFAYRGMVGRSRGASYNADTGVTTLEQAVEISGVRDGRPMLLKAAHAEMTKTTGQLVLRGAEYVVVGAPSGREASRAGLLRVQTRPDGTVERAMAIDGVKLESDRGTMDAPQGVMEMDAAGRPRMAHLEGGVRLSADGPGQQTAGESAEATASFDGRGEIRSITMRGGVGVHERAQTDATWSERELHAAQLDLTLRAGAGHGLEQAAAVGEARLLLREPGRAGRPEEQSEMHGDRLIAHFVESGRRQEVAEVEGAGHTGIDRRLADGTGDRSSADALEVHFAPAADASTARPGGVAGSFGAAQMESVVERGSVVLRHDGMTQGGERQAVDGSAREAQYDGRLEHLVLVGDAVAAESGSRVQADRIELERGSGDTRAVGRVQVSYPPSRGAGPISATAGGAQTVHVVAGLAEFVRGTAVATFHGGEQSRDGATGTARMWQGGSQIEAPVLVLRQREGVLEAHGAAGTREVHTVLSETAGAGEGFGGGLTGGTVSRARGRPAAESKAGMGSGGGLGVGEASSTSEAAAGGVAGRGGPARITSGRLVYSDRSRTAEFRDGVLLEDANGSVRSAEATATLRAKAPGSRESAAGGETPGLPTSGLERVVAKGGVVLRQPGREATGEELVYTAVDGLFFLTGSPAVPPRVRDATNGTVAGVSIRFHSGDNSVVVSGGSAGESGGRVRTETRVKTD